MSAFVSGPGSEGLRTDQAPPLAIPLSFYLVAPVGLVAAGLLLVIAGGAVTATRWLPLAMAATHLGTLGLLGAAMLGSLYQMTPVVAGRPVPWPRLAHAVQAAFVAGVAVLVWGLGTGRPELLSAAPHVLGTALALFLAPVAVALARAPARTPTVWGMRLAVLGLLAVTSLGVVLALGRGNRIEVPGDWLGWLAGHAVLGGVVWVGGLLTAVSWVVVPMFYLAPAPPRAASRATLGALALALAGAPVAVLAGAGPGLVAAVAAPAVLAVFVLHPLVTLRALRRRKKPRVDGSVRFWRAGLALAPIVPALATLTLACDEPRWPVLLGWVAIWGWAGAIVHGMLTRIVPFLVWFHRFAARAGLEPVPSMRELWPDRRVRLGLALHLGALGLGVLAILTQWDPLARATGAALAATGVSLAWGLVGALARRG